MSAGKKLTAVFALALVTILPAYGEYEANKNTETPKNNNVVCEMLH